MVYGHVLVHMPGPSATPPPLEALAGDEHLKDDYLRSIKMYKYGEKCNFKITLENLPSLKMPFKDMMQIKHFTIVVEGNML